MLSIIELYLNLFTIKNKFNYNSKKPRTMTDAVSDKIYTYSFVQDVISKTTYEENLPILARRRLEQLEKFVDSSNYRNTPMFKHKNFDGGAGRGKPYAGQGGTYTRRNEGRRQGGAYSGQSGGRGQQRDNYDGGRSGFGSGYGGGAGSGAGSGAGFSSGKSSRFNSMPNVRADEGFQFPKHKHRHYDDGFKRTTGGAVGYNKPIEPKDHEWVKQRLATTEKNREGIERHILAVRSYLNKLTDKTYNEMILNIEEEISHIKKLDSTDTEHMSKVASHIFEIASMNKFYSQVYARLYKEIIQTHPVFASILIKKHSDFVEGCKNTNYINPDVNYDGFCKYNLEVERKQATACFIAYLMNMELLEPRSVVMLLDKIIDHIYSVLKEKECRRVVEDMVEMLFAMFSVCNLEMLVSVENYEKDVKDRVKEMCEMKPKSFDGLTNKTLFRCMDILDLIK